MAAYRRFEQSYAAKSERQAQRWAALLLHNRQETVVFPSPGDKVKKALRKGLPTHLRPQAWYHYSGGQTRKGAQPHRYDELVKLSTENAAFNRTLLNQIASDVAQTFSSNKLFKTIAIKKSPYSPREDEGEAESHAAMKRILLAVAHAHPEIGYATGLNQLAATLLLVTKDEERSFWILICLLETHLPPNYYMDMNLGCSVDQEVLSALLAWKLPAVHEKLKGMEMSLHIVITDWFSNLFVDQLPFETLLRVWDVLLSEGSKVLLRIALALFKINQQTILQLEDAFELAAFIRSMPKRHLDVAVLMEVAFNRIGGFSSAWLTEERARITPGWKAKHAIRRFSRVSPAYCQAPSTFHYSTDPPKMNNFAPMFLVPTTIAATNGPSPKLAVHDKFGPEEPPLLSPRNLRLALQDSMPVFQRPKEIRTSVSSLEDDDLGLLARNREELGSIITTTNRLSL